MAANHDIATASNKSTLLPHRLRVFFIITNTDGTYTVTEISRETHNTLDYGWNKRHVDIATLPYSTTIIRIGFVIIQNQSSSLCDVGFDDINYSIDNGSTYTTLNTETTFKWSRGY